MTVEGSQALVFDSAYAALLRRYLSTLSGHEIEISACKALALHQLDQLIREIYQRTGNLGFGLEIGKSIHPSDFGVVGYAVMNCTTLLEAVEKATQYRHQLNTGFIAELSIDSETIRYRIKNAGDQTCLFPMIELDFASCFQFARMLAGPRHADKLKLRALSLRHSPLAPRETYESYFGCEVDFNAPYNQVTVDRRSFDIPVHGANSSLFRILDKKLGTGATCAAARRRFSEQLRHYLRQNMAQEPPNQADAAKHFYISVSCCKTRLKKEGTSFQQVLDDVRSEEAKRQLSGSLRPIKEISFDLGFANQSAFNRAFRRWTQQSPGDFRAQLHQNGI